MLPLLACLLLTTSAIASEHRGDIPYDVSLYSTDTYPTDYNDFGAPPKNPSSNIYYSFEQIRRDKTSQVDIREEDVGRYMYRPRITTTTRAPALVKSGKPVIVPDVYMPPVKVNRWVDPSTTMAPPPPAPSPKWDGFDLDFRQSPFSQYKSELRPHEYVLEPQQPETAVAPVVSQYKPELRAYDYVSKPQQPGTTIDPVISQYKPEHQPHEHVLVPQQAETTIAPLISLYKPEPRPYDYVLKPQQPETTVAPVISQYKPEPRTYDYVSKPQQPEISVAPMVSQYKPKTRTYDYVSEPQQPETIVAPVISQYKPEPRPYDYDSKPQQPETTVALLSKSSELYREPVRYFIQPTGEPYVNQERASEEITISTITTTVKPRMHTKVNSRGSYRFNRRELAGPAPRTLPLRSSASSSPAPVASVISQYKSQPRTYDSVSKFQQPETTAAPVMSQYKPEPQTQEHGLEPQLPATTVAPVSQSSEPYREPAIYFVQPTGEPYINQERASEETAFSTTTTTVKPRMYNKVNSRGSHRFNQRELAGPVARTLPVRPSLSRSPAPQTVRKPPPPVPTLTPWAGDNF